MPRVSSLGDLPRTTPRSSSVVDPGSLREDPDRCEWILTVVVCVVLVTCGLVIGIAASLW